MARDMIAVKLAGCAYPLRWLASDAQRR